MTMTAVRIHPVARKKPLDKEGSYQNTLMVKRGPRCANSRISPCMLPVQGVT